MNNKGFTLLEMLIVMYTIVSLFVISLSKISEPDVEWVYFSNEYLSKQAKSLINKEKNEIYEYNVHFNQEGRVNQANTIKIGNKNLIIHLGTGYLTSE